LAERIIFCSCLDHIGVKLINIKFEYYPGFALVQAQKSIESLHNSAMAIGYNNILEISTKSKNETGIKLSAFNLKGDEFPFNNSVENLFQASKVFENGGPYLDILQQSSIKAKKDIRLKESGKLIKFTFFGKEFDINPPTFFYDWLYINILIRNTDILSALSNYNIFTDIAFNSKKSINCQAYSLALFKSMLYNNINIEQLKESKSFLNIAINEYNKRWGIYVK
jgi:hypothetical protein